MWIPFPRWRSPGMTKVRVECFGENELVGVLMWIPFPRWNDKVGLECF